MGGLTQDTAEKTVCDFTSVDVIQQQPKEPP